MQGLFQTFCVRYPQAMLFFIFCSIFCSLNKDGVWGGGGRCFFSWLSKFYWHTPIFINNERMLCLTKVCPDIYACRDNNTWASAKYSLFGFKCFWSRVPESLPRDHTSRAIYLCVSSRPSFLFNEKPDNFMLPLLPLEQKWGENSFLEIGLIGAGNAPNCLE